MICLKGVEENYVEEHPMHIPLQDIFKYSVEDRVTCIFSANPLRMIELIKK